MPDSVSNIEDLPPIPPHRLVDLPEHVGFANIQVWPGEHQRPASDFKPFCSALVDKMPKGLSWCLVLTISPDFVPSANTFATFTARLVHIASNTDDDAVIEIAVLRGEIIGEMPSYKGGVSALVVTEDTADQFKADLDNILAGANVQKMTVN